MSTTTTSATRVTGIDAVHVLAKDFQRARDFYCKVLGLEVSRESPNTIEFDLGDGNAFGIGYMPDFFIPGGGAMFAVEDVREATERVRRSGVTIFEDCNETDSCTITWAADTEGNYFALHRRK